MAKVGTRFSFAVAASWLGMKMKKVLNATEPAAISAMPLIKPSRSLAQRLGIGRVITCPACLMARNWLLSLTRRRTRPPTNPKGSARMKANLHQPLCRGAHDWMSNKRDATAMPKPKPRARVLVCQEASSPRRWLGALFEQEYPGNA